VCTEKSDNSELHNSKPYFLRHKPCEVMRFYCNFMMMMMMIITIRNSVFKKKLNLYWYKYFNTNTTTNIPSTSLASKLATIVFKH
jgi:hypothetical protein